MKILYTTELSLQSEAWVTYESEPTQTPTEFIQAVLQREGYDSFPTFAKLYPSPYRISENDEIKLETETDLLQLNALPQSTTLVLTLFPAETSTILFIISIIITVATYLLIPDVPDSAVAASASTASASPNTELSTRSNRSRINGRIPDILGKVYSIPDMLMPAYKIYVDNQEVELAYMCIGRNKYLVEEIRDETTLISDIAGASAEVYTAYESKWQGHSPEVLIGDAIPDPVRAVKRISSVNGATLGYTNGGVSEQSNLMCTRYYTNALTFTDGVTNPSFLVVGDLVSFGGYDTDIVEYIGTLREPIPNRNSYSWTSFIFASYEGSDVKAIIDQVHPVYYVSHLSNIGWSHVLIKVRDFSVPPLSSVTSSGITPENIANPSGVLCNFSAANGLYRTSGLDVIATAHTIQITLTPINSTTPQISYHTMQGDKTNPIGLSVFIATDLTQTLNVEVIISASEDDSDASTSQNTIKWKDLYLYEEVTTPDQRNVTTIYTRTPATEGALSVKNRKLNCLATSRFPSWDGSTFSSEVFPTTNLVDCFAAVSLDPYIGNLSVDKLDVVALYAERQNAIAYFGSDSVGEIAITLDNIDMSYEETAVILSQAMFCEVYRRGSLIQFFLEREKDSPANPPTMLLASDNTLPLSMKFSTNLGIEYEGTSIEYIEQSTGDTVTHYIPAENLRLYKKLSFKGLNSDQAYWHGWRAWHKIKYSFLSFECEATEEAGLLRRMDKVFVADTTSLTVSEGRVMSQTGLVLTLSNAVTTPTGYVFLQLSDLLIQSIAYTQVGVYSILLAEVPRLSLSLDANNAVQTLYSLSSTDLAQTFREFLVEEKSGSSLFKWGLKGVNYDSRYYTQDGYLIIPPTITLVGANPQVLNVDDIYIDLGATAVDRYGTVLTVVANPVSVDTTIDGSYSVLYSATDIDGDTSSVSRLVLVQGVTTIFDPPTITIIGDTVIELTLGTPYIELGATATDNQGAILPVTIVGEVNTGVSGAYFVTYTAIDSYGRSNAETRFVTVLYAQSIIPVFI